MKYTKTVPYFKKGDKVKKRVEVGNTGKTKEEIMAEARSNQTREKGQQAMDKEAKLAAENRNTAADNANVSKPKTDLSGASSKARTAPTVIPRKPEAVKVESPAKSKVTPSKPKNDKSVETKTETKTKTTAFSAETLAKKRARIRSEGTSSRDTPKSSVEKSKETLEEKRERIREQGTGPRDTPANEITEAPSAELVARRERIRNYGTGPINTPVNNTILPSEPHGLFGGLARILAGRNRTYSSPSGEKVRGRRFSVNNPDSFLDLSAIVGEGPILSSFDDNTTYRIIEGPENARDTTYQKGAMMYNRGIDINPDDAILNKFKILDEGDSERIRSKERANQRKQNNYNRNTFMQKKGGTINKYEKGTRGVARTNQEQHALDMTRLPKRNIFQHMLGISPNSYNTGRFYNNASGVKTPETVSRHITPFGRDETLINKPVSYGNLTSKRTIHRGDTTYTQPNGHETRDPSFINSFTQADKRYWDGREGVQSRQQGGQVQQQPQMSEEDLIMDFTVRYLSALGVAPEDIMDQGGNLNPTYVEEVTNVFQQGGIDWESYMASPDEYVQQFVGAKMQMARKGTKLKRLSQLRIYKK